MVLMHIHLYLRRMKQLIKRHSMRIRYIQILGYKKSNLPVQTLPY